VTDATRRRLDWSRANPLGAFRAVGRLRGALPLLLVLFLAELAFTSYVVIWAYWAKAAFGWSPFVIGLSLAAFGVVAVWVQGYGIGLYLRWFGERGTILLGFASSLAFFVLFAALPGNETGSRIALILCPLSALGEVILPALQARISRLAASEAQGEALGVVASSRSAAHVIGPLIMTGIFAWGASVPGGYLYGAPYALGALLMIVCLVLFRRTIEPEALPTT
jgi:DHA1 family tetracycline resistance protein-like MFS transporter